MDSGISEASAGGLGSVGGLISKFGRRVWGDKLCSPNALLFAAEIARRGWVSGGGRSEARLTLVGRGAPSPASRDLPQEGEEEVCGVVGWRIVWQF